MPYFPPVLLASGARAGATEVAQTFEDGINVPLLNFPFAVGTSDATLSGTEQYSKFTVLSSDATAVVNAIAVNSGAGQIGFVIRRYGGTSARWYQYIPAGSTELRFFNGTDILALGASGTVGIGVISPTALLHLAAGTTARAQMRFADGVAPASANNGDVWREGTALKLLFGANQYTLNKQAAYTQTYSTAERTLSAYTSDPESSAYAAAWNPIAVGETNVDLASLANLNQLRTAYENLRAFTEDLAGVVNSLVDDMQAMGLAG